jgi:hypothetical protein
MQKVDRDLWTLITWRRPAIELTRGQVSEIGNIDLAITIESCGGQAHHGPDH